MGTMGEMSKVVVRELRPELLDDYLRLFDYDAFQDNQWWSGCYWGFYDDPCGDVISIYKRSLLEY